IRMARTLGGAVYFVASFPSPYVLFLIDGLPSFLHYWGSFPDQVGTMLQCRTGFPGFLEATSDGSFRSPTESPPIRFLNYTEGFKIVTTDGGWAEAALDAGLRDILR